LSKADPIAHAAHLLRNGGLVAFPTETVYGVGADAGHLESIERLYTLKNRPRTQPCTVHLGPKVDPEPWGQMNTQAKRLAEQFWPGPLTLIVPRGPKVVDAVVGFGQTVGLRVPAHPMCIELLNGVGRGVAATSANRANHLSPTTAAHVQADLGDAVDFILDGGSCSLGLESTVLSLVHATPTLLREGALSIDVLNEVLDQPIKPSAEPPPTQRPYQFNTPLRIIDSAQFDEVIAHTNGPIALLSFASASTAGHCTWFEMPADPQAYSAILYDRLRDIENADYQQILVERVPPEPAWRAIHIRLIRAASTIQSGS